MKKPEPLESARNVVDTYFPNCSAALLAGSVVRDERTITSDLDIVVFDETITASYRESFVDFGWPVEVFVHNLTSYKQFFKSDYERARPSMQRMISEGIVLKGEHIIKPIKKEAEDMLAAGPSQWSETTLKLKRYFITDTLEDFFGSSNRAEEIFIANTLAELLSEFVLRANRKWIGSSKWIPRSLKEYDEVFTEQFVTAFDTFYKNGDKSKVIQLTDQVLHPFGGRLFEGFSIGKD